MNITLKKYLVASFLVLSLGTANPVTAATETQIAMTQATNTAIANLEAALKAVTENKLDEAQETILMLRGARPATSWGLVRLKQKNNTVPLRLKMRVVKSRAVIQRVLRFL